MDEGRWQTLIEQFRQENYRLFQLASQSVFTVALQAGLSALKTPYPFKQLHMLFSISSAKNIISFIRFSIEFYLPIGGCWGLLVHFWHCICLKMLLVLLFP